MQGHNFKPRSEMELWKTTPSLPQDDMSKRLREILGTYEPTYHVVETETEVVYSILAGGSAKENFTVQVKPNQLIVEHKATKETKITKTFKTSYILTGEVRPGSARAKYEAGILTITIPKHEASTIVVE